MAARKLRLSALDGARRTAGVQVARRVQALSGGSAGHTVVGTLLAIEESPWRGEVQLHGGRVWLPANPGAYAAPPSSVYVRMDGGGRPVRIEGPTGVEIPDGDPGVGAEPVVIQPDLSIDPEARRRNEEVADEVNNASGRIDSAQGLIDTIRDRVGRQMWVPETFTIAYGGTDYARAAIHGDGKLRFEWLPDFDDVEWTVASAPSSRTESPTFAYRFPEPGSYTVNVRHMSTGAVYSLPVAVSEAMMAPAEEQGSWVDIEWPEVGLEDLVFPPEITEALAELWEPLISGGLVVATEAIIGPHLISTGAIEGRHLNIVEDLPSGARLSLQHDGLRVWNAGNTGPNPNVSLTLGDGFRIMRDNGTSVLWIDPATGNINTAGMVLSSAALSAPEITGGTVTGSTVRTSATGRRAQMDATGFRAWATSGTSQQTVHLDGINNWLAGLFRTSRPGQPGAMLTESNQGWPMLQFTPDGTDSSQHGGMIAGYEWDDVRRWDPVLKAPGTLGSTSVGRLIRVDGYLTGMPLSSTLFTEGAWRIDPSGRARFTSIDVNTDWDPISLQSDWSVAQTGSTPQVRILPGRMVVMRGEIQCTSSLAGASRPITILPSAYRPNRRLRLPWGWGDSMTYIHIDTDGTVWSGGGARTSSPGMSLEAVSYPL